MRTTNYSLRMFLGLFVALISAAVAAHGEMKQGNAVVKTVTGSASYIDELGFSHPLAVGTVRKEGHTIKTGVDSSVDLFLDQNGPNVGLDSSSTLRLEKLAYEKTSLGTKIDTLLDLKQGALYGSVKKLIAASRYEVKMPKGIAHVRGTEFYIDEKQGTVVVTAGSVNVSVTLTVNNQFYSKTVLVNAGQTLFIPNQAQDGNDFLAKLVPKTTSPGTDLTKFTKYTRTANPAAVAEKLHGSQTGGGLQVKKPPDSIVVSP